MQALARFDAGGRLVPSPEERTYEAQDRGYFCLTQPTIDISTSLRAIAAHLGESTRHEIDDMAKRLENLRTKLDTDPELRGLFDGVHVPFYLPRFSGDYSLEFQEHLLSGILASYGQKFASQQFRDFNSVPMAGNSEIVAESRWHTLVAARENAGRNQRQPCSSNQ